MTYTVLYVGGSGRSGSTILDNILGQVDGFVSVGELRYVWDRGLVDNRLCGCGRPFRDCPFWTEVFNRGFGGMDAVDPTRVRTALREHIRGRQVPALVATNVRGATVTPVDDEPGASLAALYGAIAEVAEARVIVDSSKLPPYGELVAGLPGVRFVAVHLIRDARATAYSWSRVKPLPDATTGRQTMLQQSASKSAALWSSWNVVASTLWKRRESDGGYVRVRYEDFIADPERTVRRILSTVGAADAELPFSGPGTVRLAPTHTVAGNPSRFATGEVELRADTEWMTRMPSRDRRLVTAATWPLLRRYGYRRAPVDAGSGS